jgi:hypothetical protein
MVILKSVKILEAKASLKMTKSRHVVSVESANDLEATRTLRKDPMQSLQDWSVSLFSFRVTETTLEKDEHEWSHATDSCGRLCTVDFPLLGACNP